jgi:hypothetical protein
MGRRAARFSEGVNSAGLTSDLAATSEPTVNVAGEELAFGEAREHALTREAIELPQSARLRFGQPEPRLLDELCTDPLDQILE